MSKKHKKKRIYTISVTSNLSSDKTKYYRSRVNILRACVVLSVVITLLAVGLTYLEYRHFAMMQDEMNVFREIIDKQKTQIEELGREKAELTSKNEILQSTVGRQQIAKQEQDEIKNERALPNAFPLTDSAKVVEPDPENLPANPITVFEMSDAADVVATGDGTVIGIREDAEFGNCVIVDHGNGYITYYRNAAEPKVNEGDEVVRGAIIFVGGLEENKLGYQITKDGEYIDPLTILEING